MLFSFKYEKSDAMIIRKLNTYLILIIIFFLAIIISLSYIKFEKYKKNIIKTIDKELFIAAQMIPYILKEDFHDRAFYKDSVSFAEDSANISELSKTCNLIKLKYLYTVIKKENQYFITSSSATNQEIGAEKEVNFYTNYNDADQNLKNAFTKNEATYFENKDKWGTYRTIAIPYFTKKGEKYLACADIDINYLNLLLRINIYDFLIDLSILILFITITYLLYHISIKSNTKRLENEIENRKTAEENLKNNNENLEKIIEHKTSNLKQSQLNFEDFFNNIDDLIFVIDENTNIVNINNSVTVKLKYIKEEILGKCISDFQSKLFTFDFKKQLENLETLKHELISFPFISKSGDLIYLEAKIIKGSWNNNDVYYFIAKDVSEIKLYEEKFSIAFDANPSAMAIVDLEQSLLLDVNKAFMKIFGYSSIDIVGKSIDDLDILVDKKQREVIKEILLKNNSIQNFETDVKQKNGSIINGIFFADIIIIKGKKCLLMVLNDITERKKAEELLLQKNNEINALLSSVPAYIYFKDKDLKYITCNNAFAELMKTTVERIAGKNDYDFFPEELAKSRYLTEYEIIKSDESVPSLEEEIQCMDGSYKWVLTNRVVFHNKEGEVAGLIGSILDISEIKKAELELSEFSEELKRSNKELEQFAYIASHDLQEPLRKVIAFGDRLKSKYSDKLDETGIDFINRMNLSASRMQKMINDLLCFSRISSKANPFTKIDLNIILKDVISDYEIAIEKSKALINYSILPEIEGDTSQITQLFNNLIGNALKYQNKSNNPVININSEIIAKNKIRISITDNGIGIEEQYFEQIFQPFIRLHGRAEYEGNGIGLAICKKIIERHKGNIKVNSVINSGSTFIIDLQIKQHNNI